MTLDEIREYAVTTDQTDTARNLILALVAVAEAANGMMPFQPNLPDSKYEHPMAVNRLREALAALEDET